METVGNGGVGGNGGRIDVDCGMKGIEGLEEGEVDWSARGGEEVYFAGEVDEGGWGEGWRRWLVIEKEVCEWHVVLKTLGRACIDNVFDDSRDSF